MTGGCPTCSGFDPLDGRGPVCRCGSTWATRPRKPLTRRTPLAHGEKGLARGTGLAPGTKGLTRGAPLVSGGAPLASGAPLARSAPAPRPRKPRVAPEVRDAVLARSGGRCEVGATDACRARGRRLDSAEGASQHHRLPGRMGGSKRTAVHAAANLLQVCGHGTAGCHGWIESHRTAALAAGWLLRAGEDPTGRPARLHDGRRMLLTATGYLPDPAPVGSP